MEDKNKSKPENWRAVAGRKGGRAKVAKGFAKMDKEKLLAVSSKGGKRSKRTEGKN